MIALYYASNSEVRAKFPTHNSYAESCSVRLKAKLGKRVILNDDLEEALSLFAAAISDNVEDVDELSLMNKSVAEEVMPEIIASVLLGGDDLPSGELFNMGQILKLGAKNKEIFKLLQSRPDLVKRIIKGKNIVEKDIVDLAQNLAKNDFISKNSAQISALLAASGVAFASSFVTVNIIESLAPAIILPVSVATLKLVPQIGEMLGGYISKYDKAYKDTLITIENMIDKISPSQALDEVKKVTKRGIEEMGITALDVSNVAKDIMNHVEKNPNNIDFKHIGKNRQVGLVR